LKKLGYNVDFIVIDSPKESFSDFKSNIGKIIGSTSAIKFSKLGKLALSLIKMTDDLSQFSNEIRAYAINKKEVNRIMDNFYDKAVKGFGVNELKSLIKNTEEELKNVELDKKINPLRIGIIGEIFRGRTKVRRIKYLGG
jgi:predicted nucleotide-binding protein (sugar kinase/HSP70/actin superfamily)